MINLKQFTKEQRFALVATALVDTWGKLRKELNGSVATEFTNGKVLLNVDSNGCLVYILRQNSLMWYTFSFTFNEGNKLAFEVTPYVRDNPQFEKTIRGIFTSQSDFERLASELPSEYLSPFVSDVLEIFGSEGIWYQTFNQCLIAYFKSLLYAKQSERLKSVTVLDTPEVMRDTFLRISGLYEAYLRYCVSGKQEHAQGSKDSELIFDEELLLYSVVINSGECYTFKILPIEGDSQYTYTLSKGKGTVAQFTDYALFSDDAAHLSSLVPREDMSEFIEELESCVGKLGLWSLYRSLGYVK